MPTPLTDPISQQMPSPAARLANRWAAAITTVYVTLGYGCQASVLVANHSAGDLSPAFILLGLLTYTSWTSWALLTTPKQLAIAFTNALGAFCSVVILVLWAIYR